MQTEDYVLKWKDSAGMALWSVVAINMLKVIMFVFPIIVLSTQINDYFEYGISPFGDVTDTYDIVRVGSIVLCVLSLVGFICYARAMKRFVGAQVFWKDERPIRQARSGIVLLAVSLALGLAVAVSMGFSLALMVVFVCMWVADIIAYCIIKDGFSQLGGNAHYDDKAQKGFRDLGSAANFSIISKVTPLIAFAFFMILAILFYTMATSAPASHQADAFDVMGYAEQAYSNAETMYSAMRSIGTVGGIIMLASFCVMALLEVVVIFLSINGWICLRKGGLTAKGTVSSK